MSAVALTVPIHREDVLHFLGYRGRGRPGARTEEALGSALAEARKLVNPRGVHRCVAPERAEELGLKGRRGSVLALGLVTIGLDLERRVTELLALGESSRALLLDAAGSAAAEEAAEDLERRIHGDGWHPARGRGRRAPRRVSPGYGAWPLTAQRPLFALLPHEEVGVLLLPSFLMTPRKSVSFAVWLGEESLPGVGAPGSALGAGDLGAVAPGAGETEAGGPGPADAVGPADAAGPARAARCALCESPACPYREETGLPE